MDTVSSLLIIVSTVGGTCLSICTSTVHSITHACISSHALSLIRQVRIWWSTSPFGTTTQFISNKHLKCLHCINSRINTQEMNHLFSFHNSFWRPSHNNLSVVFVSSCTRMINLNFSPTTVLQLPNHFTTPTNDLSNHIRWDLDYFPLSL